MVLAWSCHKENSCKWILYVDKCLSCISETLFHLVQLLLTTSQMAIIMTGDLWIGVGVLVFSYEHMNSKPYVHVQNNN